MNKGWRCSSLLWIIIKLFIPFSEYLSGSQADTKATSLTLDVAVAIVDPLLNDPACVEETRKFIDNLELNDPAFFEILSSTEDLSVTLSADPPALPLAIQEVLNNPTVKIYKDGAGITVHDEGRLKHMCLWCGKLYDRKHRADDCPNRDRGLKPHECHGECGNKNCDQSYALEELLVRHRSPKKSRFTKCKKCHIKVSKQNRARHMDTCRGR